MSQVKIESLLPDGRGLGLLGSKKVYVNDALPGEEVTLRIDKKTKNTLHARAVKILKRSPERVSSPCPHESFCTGCPLLGASESVENHFKTDKIKEALSAVDVAPEGVLQELMRPAGPFEYRYYAKEVFAAYRGQIVLGSYVAGTHMIQDNDGCPVLAQPLQDVMNKITQLAYETRAPLASNESEGLRYAIARTSRHTGETLVVLAYTGEITPGIEELVERLVEEGDRVAGVHLLQNESEGNVLLKGEIIDHFGAATISDRLLGNDFELGPLSFFQINPVSAEAMIAQAVEWAGEGELCIEGYAGVGALSLALAKNFKSVIAVESGEEASSAIERNAEANQVTGVKAMQGDADILLPQILSSQEAAVAVMDPPRRGLGEVVVKALAESSVKRLVLLSCEPKTLKRDLPALLEAGFQLKKIVPVDQFPRTAHVESVALLER